MTRARSCLLNLIFAAVVFAVIGISAYFSFRVFVRGESVKVPELIGLRFAEARATLSDTGLELGFDELRDSYSEQVPRDGVVWQSVEPGARVKRGSRVLVARSLGPLVTRVPDLFEAPTRSALVEISDRGLSLETISNIEIADVSGIVATNPPAGADVGRDTAISVLVSDGSGGRRYVMPDLIDRAATRVVPALESMQLNVAPLRYETYPGVADGIVIRQAPLPGFPVTRETLITLTISRGGIEGNVPGEQPSATLNPWEKIQ